MKIYQKSVTIDNFVFVVFFFYFRIQFEFHIIIYSKNNCDCFWNSFKDLFSIFAPKIIVLISCIQRRISFLERKFLSFFCLSRFFCFLNMKKTSITLAYHLNFAREKNVTRGWCLNRIRKNIVHLMMFSMVFAIV